MEEGVVDQLVQGHCIARRPPVIALAALDIGMKVVEPLDVHGGESREVREVLDLLRR